MNAMEFPPPMFGILARLGLYVDDVLDKEMDCFVVTSTPFSMEITRKLDTPSWASKNRILDIEIAEVRPWYSGDPEECKDDGVVKVKSRIHHKMRVQKIKQKKMEDDSTIEKVTLVMVEPETQPGNGPYR